MGFFFEELGLGWDVISLNNLPADSFVLTQSTAWENCVLITHSYRRICFPPECFTVFWLRLWRSSLSLNWTHGVHIHSRGWILNESWQWEELYKVSLTRRIFLLQEYSSDCPFRVCCFKIAYWLLHLKMLLFDDILCTNEICSISEGVFHRTLGPGDDLETKGFERLNYQSQVFYPSLDLVPCKGQSTFYHPFTWAWPCDLFVQLNVG